jgi:hypothetical protein
MALATDSSAGALGPPVHGDDDDEGVGGNERLTAMAGAALGVLLAVEALTVLSLRSLLPTHIFVGVLLIPPVLLKLGSTGYRFARYYTGQAAYRLRGAPPLLLRALAPLLVISTVALLGSGVGLVALGRHAGALRGVHAASAAASGLTISAHVLAHLVRAGSLATADWRRHAGRVAGARKRVLLIAAAVALGLGLALLAIQYDGAWTHRREFDSRDARAPRAAGSGFPLILRAYEDQAR